MGPIGMVPLLLLAALAIIALLVLYLVFRRDGASAGTADPAHDAPVSGPDPGDTEAEGAAAGFEAPAAATSTPEDTPTPEAPPEWLDEEQSVTTDPGADHVGETEAEQAHPEVESDRVVRDEHEGSDLTPETGAQDLSDDADEDAEGPDRSEDLAVDEPAPIDDEAGDSTPLYRTLREQLDTTLVDEPAGDPALEPAPRLEPAPVSADLEGVDGVGAAPHPTTTDNAEAGVAGNDADDPAPWKDDDFMTTSETEGTVSDGFADDSAETTAAPAGEVAGDLFPVVRISELHEVVDGGFGIGSAAPIEDGVQPLGHPIKANLDTKTYQDLHSPWYVQTEPDVWFLDAGFAERAGFHRAE